MQYVEPPVLEQIINLYIGLGIISLAYVIPGGIMLLCNLIKNIKESGNKKGEK